MTMRFSLDTLFTVFGKRQKKKDSMFLGGGDHMALKTQEYRD